MDALSFTLKEKKESSSIHFQISQKVSPFLQCQRKWRVSTKTRETTTRTMRTQEATWAHLNSTQTTNKTRWSKSPLLLIWLLFLVVSVDSTQTSICPQLQWTSEMDSTPTWVTDSTLCLHTWCINNRCNWTCTNNLLDNHSLSELKLQATLLLRMINLSILRVAHQTTRAKDMRRRKKIALLRNLLVRRETKLSKRSMWPSKRRRHLDLPLDLQLNYLIKSQLKTLPLLEDDHEFLIKLTRFLVVLLRLVNSDIKINLAKMTRIINGKDLLWTQLLSKPIWKLITDDQWHLIFNEPLISHDKDSLALNSKPRV